MKVGDLVRLKGDDIRGTAPGGDSYVIPAGTMGIVVPAYHLGSACIGLAAPALNFSEMEELARFSLTIWR